MLQRDEIFSLTAISVTVPQFAWMTSAEKLGQKVWEGRWATLQDFAKTRENYILKWCLQCQSHHYFVSWVLRLDTSPFSSFWCSHIFLQVQVGIFFSNSSHYRSLSSFYDGEVSNINKPVICTCVALYAEIGLIRCTMHIFVSGNT